MVLKLLIVAKLVHFGVDIVVCHSSNIRTRWGRITKPKSGSGVNRSLDDVTKRDKWIIEKCKFLHGNVTRQVRRKAKKLKPLKAAARLPPWEDDQQEQEDNLAREVEGNSDHVNGKISSTTLNDKNISKYCFKMKLSDL